MISVFYPTLPSRQYAWVQGCFLGPINVRPESAAGGNSIQWRDPSDCFVQGPVHKSTREKSIDHIVTDANLTYLSDVQHLTSVDQPVSSAQWTRGMVKVSNIRNVSTGRFDSLTFPRFGFGPGGCDKQWMPAYDSYGKLYSTAVNWSSCQIVGNRVEIASVAGMAERSPLTGDWSVTWITDYKHYTILLTDLQVNYRQGFVPADLVSYRYDRTKIRTVTDLMGSPTHGTILDFERSLPCVASHVRLTSVVYTIDSEVPPWGTSQSDLVNRLFSSTLINSPVLPSYNFGELAKEASENARTVQTNVISFVRDLRNPAELIPKLKNLSKLKGIASEYLGYKYGILPTISDLDEITKAFTKVKSSDRLGNIIMQAGHQASAANSTANVTSTQRIKIAVSNEDNMIQDLYQRMVDFGVFPTFTNLWDLVPYSFVIDWFVDVGSFLERVDARLLFLSYNIDYVTMSSKSVTQAVIASDGIGLTGNYKRVAYHRWISDQCPEPPLTLTTTQKDFDHWVEAGALILQRR